MAFKKLRQFLGLRIVTLGLGLVFLPVWLLGSQVVIGLVPQKESTSILLHPPFPKWSVSAELGTLFFSASPLPTPSVET